MKTKTMILAALIGAASVVSSMAQSVFSANAVGYVTVTIPPGFSMVANPLNGPTNSIPGLLGTNVPNGTSVFKFNTTLQNYDRQNFLASTWTGNTLTLSPGEGMFIRNPTASSYTITFVGTVPAGNLSNVLPSGFSIASSQVPQSGLLQTDLGFPPANGDAIFVYDTNTGNYLRWNYLADTWLPPNGFVGEPLIGVAQPFFVRKTTTTSWNRTFSVSQ